MEQFSLEEYLENPNRKVVTRNGKNVRIICTDRICTYQDEDYPVVGLVRNHFDGSEMVAGFKSNGESKYKSWDLFFAPSEPKTKKVGWINLYKDADGDTVMGDLYETKEEALVNRTTGLTYLSTPKIEWEE